MRRIPTPRDGQGAATFDFDAQRLRRIPGLDEPASFAPGYGRHGGAVVHLERTGSAGGLARRDLAALQLVDAAEAAMRLARSPDDAGLWSARAFTLAGLIDGVIEALASKARALGVALTRETASNDTPLVVGEPHRLGPVLGKLVSIAIEARGVVAARLSYRLRRQDYRMIGDITLVLERPASQADAGDHGAIDEIEIDSGLGLVLPPEVLAAASGVGPAAARLSVTLRLRLPLAHQGYAFARSRAGGSVDENALSGLRVLVVEDMDLNRDLLQMLLTPYGCQIFEAVNGHEALEALDAGDYDVILMDLQLPQMDGYEAMRRIRARPDAKAKIPILAVSGRAMAADVAMAKASGADGHLSKPYTTPDLVAAILCCREAAAKA
jgi:CheY-like chemotaxis protein